MNIKLRGLIEKRAKKLAEKMVTQAELRADNAEKSYLKQNIKRDKIYTKKLEYVDNLRDKTQAECNNMIASTERECETKLARARGTIKEALKHYNDIVKDQYVIDKFFKLAQSMQANAEDYKKRAKNSAQLSDNLLRAIDNNRALRGHNEISNNKL